MMKNHLLIGIIMFGVVACDNTKHNDIVKVQTSRDAIEKVDAEKIRLWLPDSTLLSNYYSFIVADTLLLLQDSQSFEEIANVYSLRDYRYKGSIGQIGEGPGEVTRPGNLRFDNNSGRLYVDDFGKMLSYTYDLDSALTNSSYQPWVWRKDRPERIIHAQSILNDTSIIAKYVKITSKSTAEYVMGRFNPVTESFVQYSASGRKGQYGVDVSIPDNLIVETGSRRDVIFMYDLEGNLLHEIQGPLYEEEKSTGMKMFGSPKIAKDRIYIRWIGKDARRGDVQTSDVQAYNLDGDYEKTLRFPYNVDQLCYNPVRNTILLKFNDIDEIGEIKLEDL